MDKLVTAIFASVIIIVSFFGCLWDGYSLLKATICTIKVGGLVLLAYATAMFVRSTKFHQRIFNYNEKNTNINRNKLLMIILSIIGASVAFSSQIIDFYTHNSNNIPLYYYLITTKSLF